FEEPGIPDAPTHPRDRADVFEEFARFVRWTVVEKAALLHLLPESERETFGGYYRALPETGDERGIRRHIRGLWRGEPGWAARWIAERARRPGARPPRVLDAGCGFGTFAMLFAAMGGEVIGADLRPDRLDVARWRCDHWRRATGRRVALRYDRLDLTQDLGGAFALVWAYNAISHIDPIETFFANVRRHLEPGGMLVIGDVNGGNPRVVEALATQRTEVHGTYVAGDGRSHSYAIERSFDPG